MVKLLALFNKLLNYSHVNYSHVGLLIDRDWKVNESHTCVHFKPALDFEPVSFRWDAMCYILRSCLLQRNAVEDMGNKKINVYMIKWFFSRLAVYIVILKERIKGTFFSSVLCGDWIDSRLYHSRKSDDQREIQIDLLFVFEKIRKRFFS